MFRARLSRLSIAAVMAETGSAVPPSQPASTVDQPYAQAYAAAKATPGNPLASPAYRFLLDKLQGYRELQSAYAVKQTEIERARKAAAVCGLEMTGSYRGPRRAPSLADGTPAPPRPDDASPSDIAKPAH